jgi:hypothetical protein
MYVTEVIGTEALRSAWCACWMLQCLVVLAAIFTCRSNAIILRSQSGQILRERSGDQSTSLQSVMKLEILCRVQMIVFILRLRADHQLPILTSA